MCHEVSCFVTIRRSHPSPSFPKPAAKSEAGPQGQSRCVMKCHEMSCFVMRPAAPLSASLAEAPLSLSCMSSLHRISFRSRRRRFSGEASLFRAYRMCARARVSRRRGSRA